MAKVYTQQDIENAKHAAFRAREALDACLVELAMIEARVDQARREHLWRLDDEAGRVRPEY